MTARKGDHDEKLAAKYLLGGVNGMSPDGLWIGDLGRAAGRLHRLHDPLPSRSPRAHRRLPSARTTSLRVTVSGNDKPVLFWIPQCESGSVAVAVDPLGTSATITATARRRLHRVGPLEAAQADA